MVAQIKFLNSNLVVPAALQLRGVLNSKALTVRLGPLVAYKPLEPREGEPRQPNEAYWGLFGAIGAS